MENIDFRTQFVIMTVRTNAVLKFKKVIEFETSCIVLYLSSH